MMDWGLLLESAIAGAGETAKTYVDSQVMLQENQKSERRGELEALVEARGVQAQTASNQIDYVLQEWDRSLQAETQRDIKAERAEFKANRTKAIDAFEANMKARYADDEEFLKEIETDIAIARSTNDYVSIIDKVRAKGDARKTQALYNDYIEVLVGGIEGEDAQEEARKALKVIFADQQVDEIESGIAAKHGITLPSTSAPRGMPTPAEKTVRDLKVIDDWWNGLSEEEQKDPKNIALKESRIKAAYDRERQGTGRSGGVMAANQAKWNELLQTHDSAGRLDEAQRAALYEASYKIGKSRGWLPAAENLIKLAVKAPEGVNPIEWATEEIILADYSNQFRDYFGIVQHVTGSGDDSSPEVRRDWERIDNAIQAAYTNRDGTPKDLDAEGKAEAEQYVLATIEDIGKKRLDSAEEKKIYAGARLGLRGALEVRRIMEELQAEGVDFNRLVQAFHSIEKKLGVADATYTEFESRVLPLMQTYRRSQTGAAATELESHEYRQLFPSVGDTYEQAFAKIDGFIGEARRVTRDFFTTEFLGQPNLDRFDLENIKAVIEAEDSRAAWHEFEKSEKQAAEDAEFNRITKAITRQEQESKSEPKPVTEVHAEKINTLIDQFAEVEGLDETQIRDGLKDITGVSESEKAEIIEAVVKGWKERSGK